MTLNMDVQKVTAGTENPDLDGHRGHEKDRKVVKVNQTRTLVSDS
jgi:hypothetical protein